MRAFIAIELPAEIKGYLKRLQEKLKSSGADVKWVEPNNIHLTLKFLGEVEEKKLPEIVKIIEDIAQSRKTFPCRISSLGAFPQINSPRIIWVGMDEGDNAVAEIAIGLEEKIAEIGIPKEDRPFSSHITIGRLRSTSKREGLIKNLGNLGNDLGKENLRFVVTKITLFKSTLTPQGPIYDILKETSLKTI